MEKDLREVESQKNKRDKDLFFSLKEPRLQILLLLLHRYAKTFSPVGGGVL